jgi:hypothetical protein
MAENLIDVKYTANNDPRDGTTLITLVDRPDIPMGEIGQVTSDEFNALSSRGCVLEVMTKSDLKEEATTPKQHSHGSLAHAHATGFSEMSQNDLQSLADVHDMDVKAGTGGKTTKKDLEDALAAAHA